MNIWNWIQIALAIFAAGAIWGTYKSVVKSLEGKILSNHSVIVADISKQYDYHRQHFSAARDADIKSSALNQRIMDHEKFDDNRFDVIQRGIETIQADIKELLRR